MATNKRQSYFTATMLCGLFLAAVFSACNKTEYEQLMRPYNSIERFTISGYGELDSISAVVSGDSIKVYWSGDTELPQRIRPSITVSAGAKVSPASGEEVAFSGSTVYTVTAEDGKVKQYTLKPVVNKAIPVLSGFVNQDQWAYRETDWQWGNGKKLKINGQYFLHYNDASGIHVYAQRLRDGYEFDLPVDAEQTTSTQVAVDLPKLTAELDSGMHRIWVKVGAYPSNGLDVWVSQPKIDDIASSVTLKEAGQTIYIGDTLHFTVNVNEAKMDPEVFQKYFNKETFSSYSINMGYVANTTDVGWNKSLSPYDSQNENPPIFEGNRIKVPTNEKFWGEAADIHEFNDRVTIVPSKLHLRAYQLRFSYTGNALGVRSSFTMLKDYADLETMRKTVFERRK